MSKNPSIFFISFLQAAALAIYILLVGNFMSNANHWFASNPGFWGPTLAVGLFSVSALICALLTLAYPFWIFWEKKKTKEALQIIIATAAWLACFVLLLIASLVLIH